MATRVLVAVVLVVVSAALLGVAVVAGAAGLVTGMPAAGADAGAAAGAGAAGSGSGPPGPGPSIPPAMRVLYVVAAATCPGLPAPVLAAVGTVESGNGTSELPGVHSGANAAGAEGPMQFLPATFAEYARPVPPGGADPPSPYDPVDAVYAAARMLCANGAAAGVDIGAALYAYNHSSSYVATVLRVAAQVDRSGALGS